jgi:hypothetical protein
MNGRVGDGVAYVGLSGGYLPAHFGVATLFLNRLVDGDRQTLPQPLR